MTILLKDDPTLERYFDVYRKTAEALAEAKSQRVRFEEARKIKKSRLMAKAEAELKINAVQKQERYAYSHDEYQDLVNHLEQAVREETRLYWELECLRAEFEAWRSLQASQRYEKQAYGVPPTGESSPPASTRKQVPPRPENLLL